MYFYINIHTQSIYLKNNLGNNVLKQVISDGFLDNWEEKYLHTSPSASLSKDFRVTLHRCEKIVFLCAAAWQFFFPPDR